jgi:hypothetical protein
MTNSLNIKHRLKIIAFSFCLLQFSNSYSIATCGPTLPVGSYQNTCTECEVSSSQGNSRCVLHCMCSTAGDNQPKEESALDFTDCMQDISNRNGTLTCG